MDRPFLSLMCDSFYNDAHIKDFKIWESKEQATNELKSELFNLMDNVKLEDKDFYVSLHKDLDRSQQQKITYLLLSEYMSQKFSGKSIYESVDLTQYDNLEQFLLSEDGGALGALGALWDGFGNLASGSAHAVSGLTSAAGAGLNAVGSVGNAVAGAGTATALGLTGTMMVSLATMAILIVAYKGLSRVGWASLSALNKTNQIISDFVHNLTRSGKVKRAVFHVNVDECYRKCNIDPKDLSRWVGLALSGKSFSTPLARDQAACLSTCYLNWNLKHVEALASSYKECLINTGERSDQMNDLSVFLQAPASSVCQAYYKLLKQHYDEFKDAVEVIFRHNSGDIEAWMRKYKDILNTALATRGKINPIVPREERNSQQSQRQDNRQPQRQGYRQDQQQRKDR